MLFTFTREARMPIAARIDEFGKPAWIVLMILGFFAWWPLGLAILAFMIGSGRMGCWNQYGMSRWQDKMDRMRGCITGGELLLPQAAIALSTNIASIRCAGSRKNSASSKSSCSGCALPRTGPSSTSSWPSAAIAPATPFAIAIPAVIFSAGPPKRRIGRSPDRAP